MEFPTTVRIKRKRGQEPLQALVLESETAGKRQKTTEMFSLRSTYDVTMAPSARDLVSENEGIYRLGNVSSGKDNMYDSLSEMVSSYLAMNQVNPQLHVDQTPADEVDADKSSRIPNGEALISAKDADDEWVYDIYYKREYQPGLEQGAGVALLIIGEEDLVPDEDSSSVRFLTDDEDSNAEDFYRNEYPDESSSGYTEDGEYEEEDDDDDYL